MQVKEGLTIKRILVVEDEKQIAKVLKIELEYEGYEVDVAYDGKRGLEAALQEKLDLILLDVMLPELNGIEVLRRIRKENNIIPIILLTARNLTMDKVTGLDQWRRVHRVEDRRTGARRRIPVRADVVGPGHRAGGRVRVMDTARARQGLDLAGSRRRGRRTADRRRADVGASSGRLGLRVDSRGGGSGRHAAVRLDVSEPVAVHAQPGVERDDLQRVVDRLHAEDHVVGVVDVAAAGDRIPGLDLLGVPPPNHRRRDPRIHRTVEAVELNLLRSSTAMRRFLAASVACGVVISATTIASAVVLAHIVAGVITDPGTRTVAHWAAPLWILVTLWVIRTLAHWLQGRLSQRGATAVIADLAGEVLRTVTALPPRQLAAQRDSAAALITRGLDGLRPYFTAYLPSLVLAGLLTPAAVVVIAVYDVSSAFIVLIALPLIPIFMVLIGLLTRDRSAASLAAMTTLQSRLLDLVAGIPTLRALDRVGGSAHRIAELGAAHRRSAMATLRIAFLSALVLELLATLGVALVAVGVGLRLVFGDITLAAGLTALLLAPEVFWPLRRVGMEFHAAQDGKTAADKAFRLLDTLHTRPAGTRTVTAAGATIHIDALDTAVEPGLVTVLTGPNGVGKTTLLQTILGLSPGDVRVAGVDVADLDPQAWWSQVAWLAQRPVLVPGSIRDNLELFGLLADLDSACRAAGFEEVLAELPNGLETIIGRDGVGLSLGQRQRLGLARALGSSAPVLLLDEPTSHLDARMESRILQAIVARARAGATVLVVGHREPVLAIGDRVLYMGSLVDA